MKRAGLSLLEVLIAIFVVLIGMLGVAAIIPAGRMELVEAAKADRSSACGAGSIQFLQTGAYYGGYFDPRSWCVYNGSWSMLTPQYLATDGSVYGPVRMVVGLRRPDHCQRASPSHCLPRRSRPSLSIRCGMTSRRRSRHRISRDWARLCSRQAVAPAIRHRGHRSVRFPRRLAFRLRPSSSPIHAQRVHSQCGNIRPDRTLFVCQDDLTIPVPKDKSERPRQLMSDSSSPPKNVAVPVHPADGSAPTTPFLVRQVQGDYTWMFTVVPLAVRPDFAYNNTAYLNVGAGEVYSVSVAVFYKRNFNADSATSPDTGEPVGTATFASSPSLGGGDVTLQIAAGPPPAPAGWLDVKQNEWIRLGGYNASGAYILRWYRIVALGEISGLTRPATLAGPDWDLTNSHGAAIADVVLYRGVVDVHTTTLKLSN